MANCKGIGATLFFAKDLSKTLDFYKTIGLQLRTEEHEKGRAHYVTDLREVHIAIYETKKIAENGKKPQGYDSAGSTVIAFTVDDVEGVYNDLMSKGFESLWEPSVRPWGKSALVSDPDGRPIELCSPV